MYHRLGTIVAHGWPWVLGGWAALALVVYGAAPRWDAVTRDGDFAYLPEWMTSVQGERLLEAAFPEELSRSAVVVVAARQDRPLEDADYELADRLVETFLAKQAQGPILRVLSYSHRDFGEKLISPVTRRGQAVLVMLQLRTEFMAVANMDLLEQVCATLDQFRRAGDFPEGLELGLTGSAAVGADMLLAGQQSIRNTELATVVLVVGILLLVYRAPGLVIVPLATIFVSLTVATGLVAALADLSARSGMDYKIFKTTRIFIVVILYGAGTDFCLFLIARYKELLQRGLGPRDAVAQALERVGGAITASAMTTVLGLGAMAFSRFGKFRNSGPTIGLALLVALAASLTLAPALLRAAGPIVFWPWRSPLRRAGGQDRPQAAALKPAEDNRMQPALSGVWQWVSRQVIMHPGWILVVSLAAMAPLAWQGLAVEVTYDLLSELQAERPSVQGTRLLENYFPAGETGPITVLAHRPAGGLTPSLETWDRIERLATKLYGLEFQESQGATTRPILLIRSLVEPLGEPLSAAAGLGSAQKFGVMSRAKRTYLAQAPQYAGKLTRLDLVCRYDPFSAESIRLLDQLEGFLHQLALEDPDWAGTQFHLVGTTAGIRDLKTITSADLRLIQGLVPVAVLVVLIGILRRPLVSVYLVLSVLVGYCVSIGLTKLFFMGLYGESFAGLDWKVPMFLFVILVAVGEDYNIYLLARVLEEQERLGPIEGLRVGVARTGGVITSCGLIMAGTFASMLFGTLRAVVELGMALALGILLDTFVIRTILVPAFLVLWDRLLRHRSIGPPGRH